MATTPRAVLITGASGGFGAPATRALLDRGLTVYAGVRSGGAPEGAVPVTLDVTDPASVRSAAKLIGERENGRGLHAIVNNAGVIVQGPLELVPEAELRRQFDVNVYGPFRVTQAFLPLLRLGHGRVVNVTAPTARVAAPMLSVLAASKAALARMSDAARMELAPWHIPVVQVEPPGARTEIFAKAARAGADALTTADPELVRLYQPLLTAYAAAGERQRLEPVDGTVRAIAAAVLADRPKTHYVVGGARLFAVLAGLPVRLRDRVVRRAFGMADL